MSGEPSAVVHAGSVTIVLTSGAADAGPHMPLASGSALRTALRMHAGSGGGLGEVKRFWEALNRQCMGVMPDRLIDAVAEAAARGRINAWVFNDPPHVTSADPDKIRADAERRAMERRRAAVQARPAPGAPAPRVGEKGLAVAGMPMDERFFEVMERALPRIGDKAGEQSRAQFEAIVNDPAVLASIVATFVILLALHAVAVGAAIDGVVLAAILASAAIRGHGLLQAARSAILGVKHMVLLIAGVASAKEEKDLDRAADEVAAVIAAIGIELLMATVGKLKGSIKQSAKKIIDEKPKRNNIKSSKKIDDDDGDGLAFRKDLPSHLADPGKFKKNELNGAHNKLSAISSLLTHGAKYEIKPTKTRGIEVVEYEYTNPVSGMNHKGRKTVYNPDIVSDAKMLELAQSAGQKAWPEFKSDPSLKTVDMEEGGLKFRVYLQKDKHGNPFIDNVHPIE